MVSTSEIRSYVGTTDPSSLLRLPSKSQTFLHALPDNDRKAKLLFHLGATMIL